MRDSESERTESALPQSDHRDRARQRRVDADDDVRAVDNVETIVRSADTGRVLRRIENHNIVTTTGKAVIANQIGPATRGNVTQIAVGDDDTAEALTDTALGNQTFVNTVTQYAEDGGGEITLRLFIGAAQNNGNTIKEAGLLNDDDELVARVTYDPGDQIAKDASITVQINWTLDIG